MENAIVENLLKSVKQLEEQKPDEALEILRQLLRDDPENPEVLALRGAIFFRLGNWDRALADYDSVISLQPLHADCYFERGTVLLRHGDVQAAMEDFSSCLSIDPQHAPALASRAALLLRAKRFEEALEDITSAAAVRPLNDCDIHNRAVVLAHLGRFQEAMGEYVRALAINPDSGGSHNNLAWLLATSSDPQIRDGNRAMKHALRAVELGDNGAWMDTLAAAHAECGNFEAAVRAETDAYRMSGESNTGFLKRMKMYRQGVSYAAWLEARRQDENL